MVTAAQSTKGAGDEAETQALSHLVQHGLKLVQRNFRVASGPRARGGEVDLIVRERDGTLVFVEVRSRKGMAHGGAAASVTRGKQQRVIFAAQHYLTRFASPPPCRFDVIAIEGDTLQWFKAAFTAD